MHLTMVLVLCFLCLFCVQATPILRPRGIEPRQKYRASAAPAPSTPSRTEPSPIAKTSAVVSSSIASFTANTSVETSPTSSKPPPNVKVSATLTPTPIPNPDPGDPNPTTQAVSCDRDRETKTWEVNAAIDALAALGTKRRCYQALGARPGAFACSRLMNFGTASVELCAPLGYSVHCSVVAAWARNVPNSCSWKPEFFYHWAVTGGMYYPPEGYPQGLYVRIGRNW